MMHSSLDGTSPIANKPMVQVKIFGYLATLLGAVGYEVSASTVRHLLQDLIERMPPEFHQYVQDPISGQFGGFYLVLNDKNLNLPHALNLQLAHGDVLSVIAPVAGG